MFSQGVVFLFLSCFCSLLFPIVPFARTSYTNDKVICENFQQLRNTKDFGFLDDFFNQGSGGSVGGRDKDLMPPVRDDSVQPTVVAKNAIRGQLRRFEVAIDAAR